MTVSTSGAAPLRVCFIVDYGSAIARNWIAYFVARGHEVHVISSYPYSGPIADLASFHVVPLAFSSLAARPGLRKYLGVTRAMYDGAPSRGVQSRGSQTLGRLTRKLGNAVQRVRLSIAPIDVHRHATRVRRLVERIQPDLVHAMRIPFEGMLAAEAVGRTGVPLLTSVWGNDFTLHAQSRRLVGLGTRRTMERTSALHTDCHRDLRLAREWGFDPDKPGTVLPGSGGVQSELFHPGAVAAGVHERWDIPRGRPVIFNARNFRPSYVRNDTFFAAIPLVQRERPDALFVCIGMAGNPVAEGWRGAIEGRDAVHLLPSVSRAEMAELFRLSSITVSPSTHDGTPNTLLEGMACGAFPVAGDIESVREWVTDGVNGLLCDPGDPRALADAMLRALNDASLRTSAARHNREIIAERADYRKSMAAAERFYRGLVARLGSGSGPRIPSTRTA